MQFESERALSQALRLLDYVALPGAAWLVSPRGRIRLATGQTGDLEHIAVARAIAEHLLAHERRDWLTEPARWSTLVDGGCVYSMSVGPNLLSVLARGPLSPADVFARMERVGALLARMLGGASRGPRGRGPRRG